MLLPHRRAAGFPSGWWRWSHCSRNSGSASSSPSARRCRSRSTSTRPTLEIRLPVPADGQFPGAQLARRSLPAAAAQPAQPGRSVAQALAVLHYLHPAHLHLRAAGHGRLPARAGNLPARGAPRRRHLRVAGRHALLHLPGPLRLHELVALLRAGGLGRAARHAHQPLALRAGQRSQLRPHGRPAHQRGPRRHRQPAHRRALPRAAAAPLGRLAPARSARRLRRRRLPHRRRAAAGAL